MKCRIFQLGITVGLATLAIPVYELFFFRFHDVALLFLCFWMFPGGLVTVLLGTETGGTWTALWVAWMVYAVVILTALRVKNRVAYYILWAVLALMLLTNVVGCHQDIVDFSQS
jgi:hypothetical protein